MHIEILAADSRMADAVAEECLVHLARCGVLAQRVPDRPWIELPECTGPPLRLHVGAASEDPGTSTSIPALMRELARTGAVPASGAMAEELLMSRLVDLGYL